MMVVVGGPDHGWKWLRRSKSTHELEKWDRPRPFCSSPSSISMSDLEGQERGGVWLMKADRRIHKPGRHGRQNGRDDLSGGLLYNKGVISFSKFSFGVKPTCFFTILPALSMMKVVGIAVTPPKSSTIFSSPITIG